MTPVDPMLKFLGILFLTGMCRCDWKDGLCDFCLNDVTFSDKRVSEGVLWTVGGMGSRAECAARCHLFEKIKSFGYHSTTGECVAYTIPLSTPGAVTHINENGFNMYSTCAPVNGGLTEWTQWGGASCSVTCGPNATAPMTRSRTCTNPTPRNGGTNCSEHTSESGDINCGLSECPVDGGWGAWGSWTGGTCGNSCGNGSPVNKIKYRSCNNPTPAYGGASCAGSSSDSESVDCNLGSCPIDGGWSGWGSWSGSCSNTCGNGSPVTKYRYRSCNNPTPAHGGASCTGSNSDSTSDSCNLASCPMSMPNFGSCTSSSQCTSPANTVCEQGLCVCDIFYQYKSGSCVQGCGSYSSAFTSFYNKVLNGYNDKIVNSVSTIEACLNLCLTESSFTCVTADYEHVSDTCYLSKTTWFGAPDGRSTSSSYYQLIRNCNT